MNKVIIELALIASLVGCAGQASAADGFGRCIQDGIDLNARVLNEAGETATKQAPQQTTVKQRLIQLKAHCRKGKLIDARGKPIYLYQLIGCWGNPPDDYLETLKHQDEEIQRLKKKYTVVQISCAQSDDPRLIK
jgi:hypothetical protein